MFDKLICSLLFLATALSPVLGQEDASESKINFESELTFQPPLVPLEFSVNSKGEPSIKVTPHCVTPIGTFGVGKGISAVGKDNNTYIIFRTSSTEAVYCVGTHGKLRLYPEGKPTIDIDHDRKHPNTIIVDIDASHGTVKAEFIPKSSTEFLAEMREIRPLISFYLAKNGDVFNGPSNCDSSNKFHVKVRQQDIQDIIFCDFAGKSHYVLGEGILAVVGTDKNQKTSVFFSGVPKDSVMAARWLCYCQKHILKNKSKTVKRVHTFNDVMHVFDDGSFYNGIVYTPASVIKSFDLDTSSYFGASINVQCSNDWIHGKTMSLGFYSDEPAEAFFDKLQNPKSKDK